jgi:hypothetical protein
LGAVIAACLIASPAMAATDAATLWDAIGCRQAPSPVDVVLDLQSAGLLGEVAARDSAKQFCWGLEPALSLDGVAFATVCVSVDRQSDLDSFSMLFAEAEVSPTAGIWLETTARSGALKRWAREALGVGRYETAATKQGASIGCSARAFMNAAT